MEAIHADMTIGEVIKRHPQTVEIMLSYGLHCVGCGANPYETIKDGTLGHGMPEEEMNKLLADLNKAVAAAPAKKVSTDPSAEPVKLSPKAASKAKELMLQEKKEGYGLRIGVVTGGCSGMSYELDFENTKKPEDLVYDQHGLKVYIAKDVVEHIQGMELDYVENLNEQGFKFNNPNAVNTCGCGSSFSA